jgi:sugar phosphate isomerase/epimerase
MQSNNELPTRRTFLCALGVAGCAAALHETKAATLTGNLGFQLFSVREQSVKDFAGTLRQAASFGYHSVELCSFRGYGNGMRENFGSLADLKPREIRTIVEEAGLSAPSSHFNSQEFEDDRIEQSIEWANGVGLHYMTLAGLGQISPRTGNQPSAPAAHQATCERLNRIAETVRKAGLQLGLHAQTEVWRPAGEGMLFDELLRGVSAKNCVYELDLSTTFDAQIDVVSLLSAHGDRFFAVHLRDAKPPSKPGDYIPSLPLGQGDLDWKAILPAIAKAHLPYGFVEMVKPPGDPMDALRLCAEYLRNAALE